MNKTEALELLGGTVSAAAKAIGISYQAVDKWPDDLPDRIVDRVQAALWRIGQQGNDADQAQAATRGATTQFAAATHK